MRSVTRRGRLQAAQPLPRVGKPWRLRMPYAPEAPRCQWPSAAAATGRRSGRGPRVATTARTPRRRARASRWLGAASAADGWAAAAATRVHSAAPWPPPIERGPRDPGLLTGLGHPAKLGRPLHDRQAIGERCPRGSRPPPSCRNSRGGRRASFDRRDAQLHHVSVPPLTAGRPLAPFSIGLPLRPGDQRVRRRHTDGSAAAAYGHARRQTRGTAFVPCAPKFRFAIGLR